MKAAIPLEVSQPRAASERAGHDLLGYWLNRCDDFMDRQRKNIIEREPSPQVLAEHIEALKFMIRVTLFFQALFADPDFSARQFTPQVAGKLLQLQESLKMLQNPMTNAEADAILQTAFPDGPGTRGPA
ncbi:MAG: hypothetical protein QOJ40_979 [Verrucomicrobiota bacterium]